MRSIRSIAIAVVLIAPIGCAETDGETVVVGAENGGGTVAPVPDGRFGGLSQPLEVSDASIAGEMGLVQFTGDAVAEWSTRDAEQYSLGLSVLDTGGYALTMLDFKLDLEAMIGAGPRTFSFGAVLEDGPVTRGDEVPEATVDDPFMNGRVQDYFNVTGCSGPGSGEVEWDVPADEVTVEVALDPDDPELVKVTFSAQFPDAQGVQAADGSFSIPLSEVTAATVGTDRTQE